MRINIFILTMMVAIHAGQVTFVVDMSNRTVVAGNGNYPAVYISGVNINGPSGLEMNDNGDGTWQLTIDLQPGNYTYKFRNGYYDYWDSPGWENDNSLIEGGCAFGTYFDRQVIVGNSYQTEGPFCFESCNSYCADEPNIEYNLIWSDEFDNNGALDNSKWYHQTQLPNGYSWYNNEIQHYTNRLENSYVSDGTLKIVAKRETFTDQGHTKQFTSARLNSKFAFTYGKVEVKAKLPEGVGTWPAIWMLGQNINEPGAYWQMQGYGNISWPYCGEIDIMEHWGGNQNYVQSALHTPSSFGGTINHGGQNISNATTGFNVYSLEWTTEKMIFSVNDLEHYVYNPIVKNSETWPFDDPQYLLLNIAIEQNISPNFTESDMEIDYVRIYESSILSIKDRMIPSTFTLYQNFPNPFNPETAFNYDLPEDSFVNITVYDILGNMVRTLVNAEQSSGYKSVRWDATDNLMKPLPAGLYFYTIKTKNFRKTKKMILLK